MASGGREVHAVTGGIARGLRRRIWIAALLFWSSLCPAADDRVTLNFVNAELDSVIKMIGQITGRNFIVDPRVKGTITVISSTPVAPAVAYQAFLSALRMQGFTVVESGTMMRIVPESEAKFTAVPMVPSGGTAQTGDRLVTQVFQLRHESAAQIVPVLRPLVAPNNTVTAVPGNNSIVVTDYADNVRRIAHLLESLDRPMNAEPEVIPLRHAAATDLAQTLSRALNDAPATQGAPGTDPLQRIAVVADLRTNSLILRTDSGARLARAKTLIEALDRPTAGGNLHVVYLKNAEAVKVAETLRGMLGVAQPATTLGSGAAAPVAALGAQGSAAGVTIHPDVANNALVINAPEALYSNLRATIEMLDTRRAQVYVEALIVEVSSDIAAEFGIQWQTLAGVGGGDRAVVGGTNFQGTGVNIFDQARNPTGAAAGLNIGVARGTITIPGVGTITNLNLLARALEQRAKANILSTPTLLTLDNEEAKIVIGQNVPFITGQYAQSTQTTGVAVTPTPFQTIERRDIGLTLRIRPQITEGGAIKLRIFQEVSSILDATNASGIIINKRSIESIVEVDDGLIVALGGLLEDKYDNGVDQVPVLGSIPVLGNLFRYETRRQVKTNLMVFLRPAVVRDARAVEAYSADRYQYLRGEQARIQPAPSGVFPNMSAPQLPEVTPRTPAPGMPARR